MTSVSAVARPLPITGSARNSAAGTTLATLVTPGTNVRGMYVLSGGISYTGGAVGTSRNARMMYKGSAPSSWTDGTGIHEIDGNVVDNDPHPDSNVSPCFIPAGNGLYAQGDNGDNMSAWASYYLL